MKMIKSVKAVAHLEAHSYQVLVCLSVSVGSAIAGLVGQIARLGAFDVLSAVSKQSSQWRDNVPGVLAK